MPRPLPRTDTEASGGSSGPRGAGRGARGAGRGRPHQRHHGEVAHRPAQVGEPQDPRHHPGHDRPVRPAAAGGSAAWAPRGARGARGGRGAGAPHQFMRTSVLCLRFSGLNSSLATVPSSCVRATTCCIPAPVPGNPRLQLLAASLRHLGWGWPRGGAAAQPQGDGVFAHVPEPGLQRHHVAADRDWRPHGLGGPGPSLQRPHVRTEAGVGGGPQQFAGRLGGGCDSMRPGLELARGVHRPRGSPWTGEMKMK